MKPEKRSCNTLLPWLGLMLGLIVLQLTFPAFAFPQTTSIEAGAVLPNPQLTPGAVNPILTQTKICASGFRTPPFRHVTPQMKARVYKLYHRKKKPGVCCEVDHLIPLELGGSNDITNLWPQPYKPEPGAHQKDTLESWAHQQVCTFHTMTLKEAQDYISLNWWTFYQVMLTQERQKSYNLP